MANGSDPWRPVDPRRALHPGGRGRLPRTVADECRTGPGGGWSGWLMVDTAWAVTDAQSDQ